MRRLLQIRSVIVYARGEQRDWFVISVVEISLTNKLVEKKNKRYGETTEYSTVISCKYEDKSNVVEWLLVIPKLHLTVVRHSAFVKFT